MRHVSEAAFQHGAPLLRHHCSVAEGGLTEPVGDPGGVGQPHPGPVEVAALGGGVVELQAGVDLQQGVAQPCGQVVMPGAPVLPR